MRVTRATAGAKALLGGKVVRVDDSPIADVIARLRLLIPQGESEAFFRGAWPPLFLVTEVLHGIGVTGASARARITVAGDDGSETSLPLDGIDAAANPRDWPNASTAPPPLFRDRVGEPLFFTYLESSKTVYVNFRRYDDLKNRSRALWDLVDRNPVQRIVIDLRQNGGGDYAKGRKYLVRPLKARPRIRPFVLIGNRTFSAAMNNAVDFQRDAGATLVGETIGERPNSYQENDELALPNSKLIVSYSTRYYEFLPGQPHRHSRRSGQGNPADLGGLPRRP